MLSIDSQRHSQSPSSTGGNCRAYTPSTCPSSARRSSEAVTREESVEFIANHESNTQVARVSNSEDILLSDSTLEWNSFWLSTGLLSAFTFILGLLSVTLVVLWNVSEKGQGFPLVTMNHYTWTYGPTAILITVVSVWQRIEYSCALLQPWRELKKGPVEASRSVLLDYVSPIIFTNLYKAKSLGHYSMMVVIIGGLLLQLVIVASTALLQPTIARTSVQNFTMEALTVFNGSDYNLSTNSLEESAFDYGAYALIAQDLTFPDGTQANLIFQRFNISENKTLNTTGLKIQALVDIFSPHLQCKNARITPINLTWYTPTGDPYDIGNLNVNVSCLECLQPFHIPHEIHFTHALPSPDRQLYGDTSRIDFKDNAASMGLFYILDVRWNQSAVPGAAFRMGEKNGTGSWDIQIMPINSIVCTAAYLLGTTRIMYDFVQDSRSATAETPTMVYDNRSIDGFSNEDFAGRLFSDTSEAGLMRGNFLTNNMDLSIPNPFWDMMALAHHNSTSYEPFVEMPLRMLDTAPLVLGYLGVQVANHYVIKNTSIPIEGEISFPATRLEVSSLAFYLMLSGLTLTTLGSVVILVSTRSKDIVPCHVGTIGGNALILSQSISLQTALRNSRSRNPMKPVNFLRQYTFTSKPLTSVPQPFSIYVDNRFPQELVEADREPSIAGSTPRPWRPSILSPSALAAMSLLCLSLIAVLEVLQRVSSRGNGIATTTNTEGYLASFGTRLVPSLAFLGVSLLYNSLSFNILLFSPFYRLRKGFATATTTINESLLDRIAPHALYTAVCHRHWAAVVCISASLVGSLFPVLVSGLYSFEIIPGPSTIMVERSDAFDPSWHDSLKDDGGAANLLTSFEMLNLSYPSLTNHELTLPSLRLQGPDEKKIQGTPNPVVSLRVPALRGSLSCTIEDIENISLDEGYMTINASSQLPSDCASLTQSIEWSLNLALTSSTVYSTSNQEWIAQMQDLHVNIPPGSVLSSGERNPTFQQDNPPGCPSLAFTFGNFTGATDSNWFVDRRDFTTMMCTQLMAEVEVEATVSIPDFQIISAEPDESTVKYLPSGPNGETAFPYRPQVHLLLETAVWDGRYLFGGFGSPGVLITQPDPNILYDGFFALMLHPEHSVKPEEMVGVENQDRLMKEIQSLYRRYMAQVVSAKMRVPANASSQAESFTATWIDPNRGVLRQNEASKLGLQVILAIMFVCGVSAYFLIETKDLLYENPCSIAGLATLLVDSTGEVDKTLRTNIDWTQKSTWKDFTFSLRWWDSERGRKPKYYGIDVENVNRGRAD